jgi:predicted outer membrane repeat protein
VLLEHTLSEKSLMKIHLPHLASAARAVSMVVAFSVALLAADIAQAATYVVGTPVGSGQCTHATVQAAVNAAAASPGADTIRVTRSVSWTAQQISINSDQDLDLLGGFANCTASAADGTATVLDGNGGDPRPVFAIRGNGIVHLRNLTITGGDQDGDDNGGGIYYEGGGELDIDDSTITNNIAYDGGGIYAAGTSTASELVLGENVVVSFNTARKSGGGVVAKSLEMSLRGPGSTLMFNEAHGDGGNGGNGGGLAVVSEQFKSYAYISSSGIGGIGAIYGNSAVNGGGIAVLGGEESGKDAIAEVFSTNSAADVLVNGNSAIGKGGAIYLHTDTDETGGNAVAYALLNNATIDDNSAPDGAAFYLDYDPGSAVGNDDYGSKVYFVADNANYPVAPDAASCPFGRPCGFITNNATTTTTGAVIRVASFSRFEASRIAVQGNEGGRLIYLTDTGDINNPSVVLDNTLITGNAVTNELLRQAGIGHSDLDHVTIADNNLGTSYVLHMEDDLSFTRSLVSQPGLTTFETPPPTGAVSLVISNDASLAGANTYAAPRFVDPERGDYNLQAGSVAVDYAPAQSGDDGDINSHTRNLDLPGIPNQAGPGDAGAFEREHFDPLVLNPDFDQDLHLWDVITSAQWDGTQNAAGAAGSGSLEATLSIDDTRLAVRAQCIHIPGPGIYLLNGWGRASHGFPGHNRALLAWEVRHDGGVFGCTDGAPDATGELVLADDTTWHKPAVPAAITVADAAWGNNASLTIYAVGINGNPIGRGPMQPYGGPDAWFDGITLTRVVDDVIFRNGFELP